MASVSYPAAGAGILWLARDFRFSDNPALLAACRAGPLLAVFCLDARTRALGAAPRWRLQRALQAFDAALRGRSGRGILLLEGEPEALLPELMAQTGATEVHGSDWPEPGTRQVQDRLRSRIGDALVLHPGHLLIHPARLRTGQGSAYKVYTPFARALHTTGPDRPVADAPARIEAFAAPPQGLDPNRLNLAPEMARAGAVLERCALPAGEAAAFERLDSFLGQVAGYSADRDRPDLPATSGLSEHLALGEISPRSLWAIASLRAEAEPHLAGPIGKFLSELIWREFAWHLLIGFPRMATQPWRADWAGFPWQGANPGLTGWIRASTGIALVDAGLREMWVTGRMHNRVRMVVASWLTKNLLTDWRLGLAHFEDCLTDWDPASNAMNWQWVAGCGPDAAPYFRIFNPEKQAATFDPATTYRNHWLHGPGARAFHEAAPRSWQIPDLWQPGDGAQIASGRARALAALDLFRQTGGQTGGA